MGLTEAEIYERDPALLPTGYTFEDVVLTSTDKPSFAGKTAQFSLNKDKQMNALANDAALANFTVIVNDNDKNVGIQCSTAFYDAVAKPVMCGLSKDATLNINNISVNCSHIDFNRDSNGYEYNRVLHVRLGGSGQFSIGKVTIHLHHTKRLIQMQGSALMPDGTRSPVWFLNTFVKERFARLAKLKQYDITALNDAVRRTVEQHKVSENIGNNCCQCLRLFASNAKPTQCINCSKYFHKTGCLPAHSSSCYAKGYKSDTASASRTTMSSSSVMSSAKECYSSSSSSKRPRTESSSIISLPQTSSLPTTQIAASASPPNSSPANAHSQIESAYPSQAKITLLQRQPAPILTTSISTATTAATVTTTAAPSFLIGSSSSLNVNAAPFNFVANLNTKRKPKPKAASISPETAKIDYLNLELNAAKTRIVQLETTIDDQEVTINIQREKIKLLEQTKHNSANTTYGFNSHDVNRTANDVNRTAHGVPGSISCHHQVPNYCPSLLLQCHHGSHLCHGGAHPLSQQQQQQPGHPPSEANGNSPLEQVALLKEIKRALGTINDGIANIAGNVVLKDEDKKIEATNNTDEPFKKSEHLEKDVQTHNTCEDDTEHIEVVSVELINIPDGDDSFASADDFVPELSAPEHASLNCEDPTSQQILLMQ